VRSRRQPFAILCCLALLLVPVHETRAADASNDDAKDTGLAVMDLVAVSGVPKGLDQLLNEALLTRLKKSGRFRTILSSSDMRDLLDLEQQKTTLGCDASNCLVELGGALGVPYLLVPTLGRLGERYLLQAKVLMVEEARVVARSQVTTTEYKELLEVIDKVSEELIAQTFGEPLPSLGRKRMRQAGVVAVGLGLVGSAYGYWQGAQKTNAFQQSINRTGGLPNQATAAEFQQGMERADQTVAVGLGAVVIGAILTIFGLQG